MMHKNGRWIKEGWKIAQCLGLVGLATFLLFVVAQPARSQTSVPGACLVEDGAFATANGGCKDLATGQVWSADGMLASETQTWMSQGFANGYCNNLVEGDYSDWRLPTVTELQTVAGHGAATHFNEPDWLLNVLKWSSTQSGGGKGGKQYWAVYLKTGIAESSWQANYWDAHCVR